MSASDAEFNYNQLEGPNNDLLFVVPGLANGVFVTSTYEIDSYNITLNNVSHEYRDSSHVTRRTDVGGGRRSSQKRPTDSRKCR